MEYHTTFLSLPEGRRIIAVSDIHGDLSLLKALLEKIRYKPGDDLLFLVGDTVEKETGQPRHAALCDEAVRGGDRLSDDGERRRVHPLDAGRRRGRRSLPPLCKRPQTPFGQQPDHRGAGRTGPASGRSFRRPRCEAGAAQRIWRAKRHFCKVCPRLSKPKSISSSTAGSLWQTPPR